MTDAAYPLPVFPPSSKTLQHFPMLFSSVPLSDRSTQGKLIAHPRETVSLYAEQIGKKLLLIFPQVAPAI